MIRAWWLRLTRRGEQRLTGKYVSKDGLTGKYVSKDGLTGKYVCAGCGPWCEDHGWKVPEPTGNPEADLAAAKAFAARVTAYLPVRNDT